MLYAEDDFNLGDHWYYPEPKKQEHSGANKIMLCECRKRWWFSEWIDSLGLERNFGLGVEAT